MPSDEIQKDDRVRLSGTSSQLGTVAFVYINSRNETWALVTWDRTPTYQLPYRTNRLIKYIDDEIRVGDRVHPVDGNVFLGTVRHTYTSITFTPMALVEWDAMPNVEHPFQRHLLAKAIYDRYVLQPEDYPEWE